ncbi:hypothetical protein VTJ04DRAFT_4590 [Mycothermus thermophilus]|uniref:uncharacterized protein n=1 Tax=Humicola insolens TaxID=85995 RepID=UPI0037431C98
MAEPIGAIASVLTLAQTTGNIYEGVNASRFFGIDSTSLYDLLSILESSDFESREKALPGVQEENSAKALPPTRPDNTTNMPSESPSTHSAEPVTAPPPKKDNLSISANDGSGRFERTPAIVDKVKRLVIRHRAGDERAREHQGQGPASSSQEELLQQPKIEVGMADSPEKGHLTSESTKTVSDHTHEEAKPQAPESLALYHYHKETDLEQLNQAHMLLDPESHAGYQTRYPGTVTVEGLSIECSSFLSTKPARSTAATVDHSELPAVSESTLFRRIQEIQQDPERAVRRASEKATRDLHELIGTPDMMALRANWAEDPKLSIRGLLAIMDRPDTVTDWTQSPTIDMPDLASGTIGKFLRQILLGWELKARIRFNQADFRLKLTQHHLASIIVSDRWLKHVKATTGNEGVPPKDSKINEASNAALWCNMSKIYLGKWFPYKIMAALVASSPDVHQEVGDPPHHDELSGLLLRYTSYWRSQSVFGRVLCRETHLLDKAYTHKYKIPIELVNNPKKILENDFFAVPEKPTYDTATYRIDFVTLTQAGPSDQNNGTSQSATSAFTADKPEPPASDSGTASTAHNSYLASITFTLKRHTFKLSLTYNPLFVSLPACSLPKPGEAKCHEVPRSELDRYAKSIWTIDKLVRSKYKDRLESFLSDPDNVLVINVDVGFDAEVIARAWCAQHGRNAVVKHRGGPCYACAYRAASKEGLGTGVLIWVN